MKNKYILLSTIVFLGLIIYLVINETTAKYNSSSNDDGLARAAKFTVSIKSLLNGELSSFEENLRLESIEHTNAEGTIKEGKIAPGFMALGSFVIDASGTEVATRYTINIGNVEYGNNTYNNFKLYSVKAHYTDSSGKEIEKQLEINNIDDLVECSDDISLDNINNPITIEVTVIWDYTDDEENVLGIDGATLNVPIIVTATQLN